MYDIKLKLRVEDEEIEFNMKNMMKYPPKVEDCWSINEVDHLTEENFSIPTIDQFKEKIVMKEAENKDLNRKERDSKKLMYDDSTKNVKDKNL